MSMTGTVEAWVVSGLAVAAAAGDLRTGRIPNVLTFASALAAFLFSAMQSGTAGLVSSLMGYGVGILLFLPLFAVRGMGAGDVKLLAAFGAWLGPMGAIWTALWASIAGGVLAAAISAWNGYLSTALRNVITVVGVWRSTGPGAVAGITLADAPGPRIAYAVPLGVGAVITLCLKLL
jgi:prepilin peptidase CpaA